MIGEFNKAGSSTMVNLSITQLHCSGVLTTHRSPSETCEAAKEDLAKGGGAAETDPEFKPVENCECRRKPAAVSVHSRDHPEAKRIEPAGERNCQSSVISPHLLLQVGSLLFNDQC